MTCLLLLAAARSEAGYAISVDASPSAIAADGKSHAQILVTVLNPSGGSVPDDTEVRLTTSAGDITPVVYTSGGRAIGILTSSSCPQIATIGASVETTTGSIQIEFLASEGDDSTPGVGTIRLTGGSLAYSVDRDTVVGSGGVSIECRGATIQASAAQVCQRSGQIRAQGEVSVRRDDQSLTADALACDIRTGRFRLMQFGSQPEAKTYDLDKLRPSDALMTRDGQDDFTPLLGSDGNTWIVCNRIVVIPGEKILFYKASIYVGDSKVIRMPYYSYSYEKRESILQQVRFTSGDGVRVDLPLYYQMTDSRTGALKLRYAANGNEAGGYTTPRRGMSLGLEQDYSIGAGGRGRFFVDAIGSSTQAFEFSHHLEYGSILAGGRADLSARYQPSSSYAKQLYYTTLNMSGSLSSYSYMVSGYYGGSSIQRYNPLDPDSLDYEPQSTFTLRTTFRPKSSITSSLLGKVTPNYTLGYSSLSSASGVTVSPRLYESTGFGFSRGQSSSRMTAMSFDGTTSVVLTARGDTGASLRMGPTLRHRWTGGNTSLRYSLNLQSGTTDSGFLQARHQIAWNVLLMGGGKWNSSSMLSYGLDSGRLNLYTQLNYRLAGNLQIRSNYNLFQYAYRLNNSTYRYGTSYLKVGVYRPIGMYEIGLAWSPDGRNYGMDKSKRLWLELNGTSF